jgi:uncharacterized membrane protein
MEKDVSKILRSLPDPVVSLVWALVITGACYSMVIFAKFIRTLPQSFDLPWILLFISLFLIILVKKRLDLVRSEQKPHLMENK